jgi:hypothetical protein
MSDNAGALIWAAAAILLIAVFISGRRARRRGGALRGGVIGANYDWLSPDKRNAAEYIVEDQAEARDPRGRPKF